MNIFNKRDKEVNEFMQISLCLNKHAFMRILTPWKGCEPPAACQPATFLVSSGWQESSSNVARTAGSDWSCHTLFVYFTKMRLTLLSNLGAKFFFLMYIWLRKKNSWQLNLLLFLFLLPSSLQPREWVGPCRYRVTPSTRPSSPREPSRRTRATWTVTAASSMRHTRVNPLHQ